MKITPCKHKNLSDLHTAPVLVKNSIEIDCSAAHLFAILEDGPAWPLWASSLTDVTWTSPKPFGMGTTRKVAMSGGIVGVEEFVAWQTDKQMAFCFTESSMPNMEAFGEDYQLESLGDNKVRLTWYAAFWPSNIIAKLSFALFKPFMGFFLGGFLKKLKTLSEGDYQPQPAVVKLEG
ncbi:MAG: SRPBCC family protein [Pseudomonadales bacterium]|nr:SRPBCC family protein [Pseudomonadales bacterium]